MRWSGVLVACGALIVSVLAGCGGLTDQGDDVVNGKQLFVSAGRGQFKPTVHGEIYLKNSYKVKKGTKTRPKASA